MSMFRVGDQIQVVAGLRGGKIAPDGPQLGEVYTVTGIRATSTEDRAVRLDRAVGGYSKGTYWSISRFNLVVKAMVLYPGDKVRVIAGSQFLSVGELLTVVEVYTDYGYGNTETGLYRHFVIADVEKLMEPLDEGKTAEPGETLDSFKAKVYEVAQKAKAGHGWTPTGRFGPVRCKVLLARYSCPYPREEHDPNLPPEDVDFSGRRRPRDPQAPHDHRESIAGCFRCDLRREETTDAEA